jgi:tellurite resistance protein
VDVPEFAKAVRDPSPTDLLPVLYVPKRYFERDNQAWMLLPGYEKQERANREWQELMRQAMIAAGGCIVVTDETRMANKQQLEIVKDMLKNELRDSQPYIVISKTESRRNDPKRCAELIASAKETFQIKDEIADKHIILSGVDDAEYVKEWMPKLKDAIGDLNFTGQSSRGLQMSNLSEIISKELFSVLNMIRSKSRMYAVEKEDGTEILEELLDTFDCAAEQLRAEHIKKVSDIANQAFSTARNTMIEGLQKDHEGFKNWIFNAMDSTSETEKKMRTLVLGSWEKATPQFYSEYADSLKALTSKKLGQKNESDSDPKIKLEPQKLSVLTKLGYVSQSERLTQYDKLNKQVVSDVRILLGVSSQQEEKADQTQDAASKQLKKSVQLLPALTLEYSRIAYTCSPKDLSLKENRQGVSETNVVKEITQNVDDGTKLARTAIRSFAALLAVDVGTDGDVDLLSIFSNNPPPDATPAEGGSPNLPLPVTLHPAAIAVAAVVAGAYVASKAVTGLRTYEKDASIQAQNMLAYVRDQHIQHLRSAFDEAMGVIRDRVEEKLRARYRMDETLMHKDRLARAIADVKTMAEDLRYELNSSNSELSPFLSSKAS